MSRITSDCSCRVRCWTGVFSSRPSIVGIALFRGKHTSELNLEMKPLLTASRKYGKTVTRLQGECFSAFLSLHRARQHPPGQHRTARRKQKSPLQSFCAPCRASASRLYPLERAGRWKRGWSCIDPSRAAGQKCRYRDSACAPPSGPLFSWDASLISSGVQALAYHPSRGHFSENGLFAHLPALAGRCATCSNTQENPHPIHPRRSLNISPSVCMRRFAC